MNTAEKIEPIPEKSLTQQIAEEKEKLRLMRQRSTEAINTLQNFQKDIDKARDDSDEKFYLHTSVPSENNSDAYTKAKQHVMKLNIEYEEAKAAERRLPKRLKETENLIHSLQRQKQVAVQNKANEKLGKKKEVSLVNARDSIVSAVALTACCSELGNLDNFLSLGSVNIHALVTKIVSSDEFRMSVDDEYKRLMKSLRIEEL